MIKSNKYTKEELKNAVSNNTSLRQVLIELNLKPAGGNYQTIKRIIKELDIDTSHMKGHAWNKGKKRKPYRSLSYYLVSGSKINSFKLKNRLLKEGVLKYICSNCKNKSWMGYEIPLELDHINGINDDNRIENLRLLCPNCHAQTSTYRGKNINKQGSN